MFRSSTGGAVVAVTVVVLVLLGVRAELRRHLGKSIVIPQQQDPPRHTPDFFVCSASRCGSAEASIWDGAIWPARVTDARYDRMGDISAAGGGAVRISSTIGAQHSAVSFSVQSSSGQIALLYGVPGDAHALDALHNLLEEPKTDDTFDAPRAFIPIFAKKLEDQ